MRCTDTVFKVHHMFIKFDYFCIIWFIKCTWCTETKKKNYFFTWITQIKHLWIEYYGSTFYKIMLLITNNYLDFIINTVMLNQEYQQLLIIEKLKLFYTSDYVFFVVFPVIFFDN